MELRMADANDNYDRLPYVLDGGRSKSGIDCGRTADDYTRLKNFTS